MAGPEPSIAGVCPILATPFTEDDAVDYESLRTQIEFLERGGSHAVALFGWASEYYKLTDEERDRMVEVAVEATDTVDLPLVASVTHESTRVAERWASEYEAAGADCVMVLPGNTRGPSKDGVLDHVRRVGRAVDVPVMVQLRADGPSVAPDALAAINDEVPNVRYFKIETDSPGPYISELLAGNDDVHALVGNAGVQMIDALERGAVGVMPGSSLFDVYLRIYEHYRAGRLDEAVGIHAELHELIQHVLSRDIVGYEKEISARRGMIATDRCRAPNPEAPDDHHRDLFETYYDRVGEYFAV